MFCPYCGEENPDGERFCGACGKELPIIENPPVSPEKGETLGADDNAGAEAAAPVVNCGQPVQQNFWNIGDCLLCHDG